MGDARFTRHYERLAQAEDPWHVLRAMSDDDIVSALAASTNGGSPDPYLANVIATEAQNRMHRARAAVEHLGEGIVQLDRDARVAYVNPAAERLLGWRARELVGRNVHEAIHHTRPDGSPHPAPECANLRVFRTGVPHHSPDDWFLRKDGTVLSVAVTTAPVFADGEVAGAVFVFRDITEQKRTTAAAQRLAAIVESSDDAIMGITPQGTVDFWNAAAERLFGWSAAEAVGMPLSRLMPPERVAEVREGLDRVQRGESVRDFETIRRRKDGSLVPVSITAGLVRDHAGRIVGTASIVRDISARKEAEAALRESEERFRGLVEQSPLSIQLLSPDGRIRMANRAWQDLWGIRDDELGAVLASYNHLEDPLLREAGLTPNLRRAFGGETVRLPDVRYEPERAGRRGRARWVSAYAYPLRDPEGRVREVVMVQEDVTQSREAALRLAEGERRFRATFEQAAVGIAHAGLDGSWLRVNRRLCDIVGYSREELLARRFQDITHPEDLNADLGHVRRLLDGEAEMYRMEKRYLHKDGRVVWILLTVTLVRDEEDRPDYFIGVVEDISERRTAEEALAARARQQAAVAALGAEALAGLPLDALVDRAVRVVAETLGVEYAKVLRLLPSGGELVLVAGVGWREGLVGRATVSAGMDSQAGYTLNSDAPVIVRDLGTEERFTGSALLHDHGVVSGMSCIIPGPPGAPPYGVFGAHTRERRDFSPDDVNFLQAVANVVATAVLRARDEEALRGANRDLESRVAERTLELQSVNGELEAFAYSVSHDLRAPLRGIGTMTRMLAEDLRGRVTADETALMERVRRESERLSALIGDLLTLSRVGRDEIHRADVDAASLAREVEDSLRHENPERRVRLVFGRELRLDADPALARVVMENLLGNAWKYTGRREDARIEVDVVVEGDGRRWLVVRDNGEGFDPAAADRLFLPFARLHGPEFEGSGVGLATVRRIVERHGGAVRAEGRPGEGAAFFVTFDPPSRTRPGGTAS